MEDAVDNVVQFRPRRKPWLECPECESAWFKGVINIQDGRVAAWGSVIECNQCGHILRT